MADLIDNIESFLKETDRPVPASDLARRFLRLTAGPVAEGILRAVLVQSPALREVSPGTWAYRAAAGEPWAPRLLLELDPRPGREREPASWSVGFGLVDASGRLRTEVFEDASQLGPGWLEAISHHPAASTRPARARRWLDYVERAWTVPPASEEILDLKEALVWVLTRRGGVRPEPQDLRSPSRWPALLGVSQPIPDGPEGVVAGGAVVLQAATEESPDAGEFLAYVEEGGSAGHPVDFSPFEFSRNDLADLPEVPGVYIFSGEGDACRYVGKAKNLRRRVGQYFLPLGERSKRRTEFLEEVSRLEWVALPSELAALIVESSMIRRLRPKWNVQVETHAGAGNDPPAVGGLLFAIPSALQSRQRDVYLLDGDFAARSGDPLDLDDPPAVETLSASLRDFFSERKGSDPFRVLDPQEAILARRWYARRRDDLLKVQVDRFSSWNAATTAALGALGGDDTGGAWVRESL